MHPLLGILLYAVWFGAGVLASLLLAGFAGLASLGEVQTGAPAPLYWLTVIASWSVIPMWLSFGWAPCAWRAWRDRPVRKIVIGVFSSQLLLLSAALLLLSSVVTSTPIQH